MEKILQTCLQLLKSNSRDLKRWDNERLIELKYTFYIPNDNKQITLSLN